ncbi:MAG: hypothetical protein ACE5OZ_06655 [Candidatus Heimdallarchaeota archaeon]
MPICSSCGSYCVRLPCPVCAQTDEERRGLIKANDASSPKKWQITTRRTKRGSSMLAADETERLRRLTDSQMKHVAELEEKFTDSAYGKLEARFNRMQKEAGEKERKSAHLSSRVAQQEKKIQSLEIKLVEEKNLLIIDVESLRKELASAKATIEDNMNQKTELEKEIGELRNKAEELKQVIHKQEQQLAESTRTIENLNSKIQVLSSSELSNNKE